MTVFLGSRWVIVISGVVSDTLFLLRKKEESDTLSLSQQL